MQVLDLRDGAGWTERAVDVLLEVADLIPAARSAESVLNRIAVLAVQATGADRSAIFVRDPAFPARLLPAAGGARSGVQSDLRARFRAMRPVEILEDEQRRAALWDLAAPFAVEKAQESSVVPEDWKREWGSASIAFAPIRAGGESFGLMAVDYAEDHHKFTEGELKLLGALANASAIALQGAQLVSRLERAAAAERRLSECAAALHSQISPYEMLDFIAARFSSLLPETYCAIYLLTQTGQTLKATAFTGWHPPDELDLDDLPAAKVAAIRRIWDEDPRAVVAAPDMRTNSEWTPFSDPGIGKGLLVPLPIEGELLGVVYIGRASGFFTDDEIRIASAFGDHAAIAISHARMQEILSARLGLVQALLTLSDTVGRTSGLKSALSLLNSEVCGDAGLECARIALADATLADTLGANPADQDELRAINHWRRNTPQEPIDRGELRGFMVPFGKRPEGILWVRLTGPGLSQSHDLARAVAVGLGEIACKAKLRHESEQRNRELSISAERERIARDLHDTVGQALYGLGLKLEDAMWRAPDELKPDLAGMRALAARGLGDVRSAVYALSFLHVRQRGLASSLRALARQFRSDSGVPCRVRIRGNCETLPEELKSALYRTAHEALLNVERHARATAVVLTLARTGDDIELVVRDDGVGLANREVKHWRSAPHFGMRSMARTIQEVGGKFWVEPSEPRGLTIHAIVPKGEY